MKFAQRFLAVAATLALSQSAALAQGSTAPMISAESPGLGRFDTDHNGSISPSEAAVDSALTGQFVRLDSNRNGVLEPAEFARFESFGGGVTPGTPTSPTAPTGRSTPDSSSPRTPLPDH